MSIRRRLCVPPAPKLPSGLVELMDGLARDVLKNNPDNIYEFCAQHMQTLLELRDGHAHKSFLTLDQKIAKAQKKVKERAEQRRRVHDEQLRSRTSNVDVREQIMTTSDISPDGTKNLTTSENKKEKEETESNGDENEQEKPSDAIFSELKNPDSTQKDQAIFGLEDAKQDMEKNDINNQEALETTLAEDEHVEVKTQESDDLADNKNINYSVEKISLEQNENQIADIGSAAPTLDENETFVKSEVNDHIEEKFNPKTEDEKQLQENYTEYKEIDAVSDMSEEIISKNDELENAVSSAMITHLDQTSDTKHESGDSKNRTGFEDQEVSSLESTNLPKQYANDNLVNEELKTNSVEIHIEDVNQEDHKILAVILSKSVEPDTSDQHKEADMKNELDQKISEVSGSESAVKSTDDKAHSSSMDLETAAITIQKVFRSFLFKTKSASYDDPTTVDMNLLNQNKDKDDSDVLNKPLKDRRSLGISRMDTVLQTVNEEKSLSLSTDDSSTLSSAATIIQAHVRGYLARNKFYLNKTTSTNSCMDSDGPSILSLEADSENRRSKTVLNIHIVPEGGHFISRDESILTSMDLSLDNSPPSSVNLHPLGYDKSERRKQLKREDAIQSVSPPSNNSGKLSDDIDSVKDVLDEDAKNPHEFISIEKITENSAFDSSNKAEDIGIDEHSKTKNPEADLASDEMDVITPFVPVEDKSFHEPDNESRLLHSGEFHDILVPTNVSRCDTSVVREFQNVLVYFILWNN